MTTEQKQSLVSTPLAIILAGVLVAGVLYVNENGFNLPKSKGGSTSPATAVNNSGANKKPQTPPTLAVGDVPKIIDQDHIRGNRNAPIALIEYSDYECPFCKQFHKTAQQAVDEYKGQVMWVYRHYPLAQLHSKAPKEAEAAECVAKLGGEDKFWQFTDKIFEVTPSNNGLAPSQLPQIASELGLNKDEFQECLDSGQLADLVQRQMEGGTKAGVTGTPGNILLNTKTGETRLVPGAVPFGTLKQAIDAMLQK